MNPQDDALLQMITLYDQGRLDKVHPWLIAEIEKFRFEQDPEPEPLTDSELAAVHHELSADLMELAWT